MSLKSSSRRTGFIMKALAPTSRARSLTFPSALMKIILQSGSIFFISQRIFDAESEKEQLRLLSNYLQTIGKTIRSTPMFVAQLTTTSFSSQSLESSNLLVKQLIEGTKHLTEFVQLRTAAYLLLLRHLEAIMCAVLTPTVHVHEWLTNHNTNPSKTADELLPETIRIDALPIALQQARDALTELDTTITKADYVLEKAFSLNTLLQSPAIEKFLNGDKRCLALFLEWRPRFEKTFTAIVRATKS